MKAESLRILSEISRLNKKYEQFLQANWCLEGEWFFYLDGNDSQRQFVNDLLCSNNERRQELLMELDKLASENNPAKKVIENIAQ